MTSMAKSHFWVLDSPPSLARLAEWVHDEVETESIICPANDGHQRGGRRLTNLSVTLSGHDVEDIVWTWGGGPLLTDHVLELFRSAGFTGFRVKPVKAVFKRSKERPPRLWELVVTGWGGIAPPESGVRLLERCDACGLHYYSQWTKPDKLIDPAQWDGSDFFLVWLGGTFVTQRVADLIRTERLTGVVLKLPSEMVSANRTGKIGAGPPPDHNPRLDELEGPGDTP